MPLFTSLSTTRSFWGEYAALPKSTQNLADQSYELLKFSPSHPSLHFKKVGKYWSVRVSKDYRALSFEVKDGIALFWIGTHAEYQRIISQP
jgi:hypothetical protein